MEDIWLTQAKKLQAIAATGLHYTADQYDAERYFEIRDIAQVMLSMIGSVPIRRIQDLVSDTAKGYATPKVDVRGAVIDGDAILLVREKNDGLWALPGGFADVGLSASENIEKEILEEAGLKARAKQLYALRHKAKGPYAPDTRDFYKLFFLCAPSESSAPRPGTETRDAKFIHRDHLPELSKGRTVAADIEAAFDFLKDGRTRFD